MNGVTVITPTRNRPVSFGLLERWIGRQTYTGPLQWIVVNDGTIPYDTTRGQTVISRHPRPGEGHSLPENLLAAIPHVEGEFVFICEDDDWYAPTFIAGHLEEFDQGADIVGCKPSRHYNLLTRRFRTFQLKHCNLGSTGFRRNLLDEFKAVCLDRAAEGSFGVDVRLWKTNKPAYARANESSNVQHVGLKGMPGEPGLGMGHKLDYGTRDEPGMPVLRQWIGEADWDVYRRITYVHHGN